MTVAQPDPRTFAESARQLLIEDRSQWRRFGCYWFLVKALLRRFYTDAELPLGTYEDQTVIDRMPKGVDLPDLLAMASDEFTFNASLGAGRAEVEDPDGETFLLIDPDMGV